MTTGQTIIITLRDIILLAQCPIRVLSTGRILHHDPLLGYRSGTSCIKDPRGRNIPPFVERMIHTHVQAMPPVILIRETPAPIDTPILEDSITLSQGISQPPGSFSPSLLSHGLQSHRTPASHTDFVFPAGSRSKKRSSVLILQHITHILIISLQRELPSFQSGIIRSKSILRGVHRSDMPRNGDPQIGRQSYG